MKKLLLKTLLCILPILNPFCLPMAFGFFVYSFQMLFEGLFTLDLDATAKSLFMIGAFGPCLYIYGVFALPVIEEWKKVCAIKI